VYDTSFINKKAPAPQTTVTRVLSYLYLYKESFIA